MVADCLFDGTRSFLDITMVIWRLTCSVDSPDPSTSDDIFSVLHFYGFLCLCNDFFRHLVAAALFLYMELLLYGGVSSPAELALIKKENNC